MTKREILKSCADLFGVSVTHMMSGNRSADHVWARFTAMRVLHAAHPLATQAGIAKMLNQNRTQVTHGLQAFQERMETDQRFHQHVTPLLNKLTNGANND